MVQMVSRDLRQTEKFRAEFVFEEPTKSFGHAADMKVHTERGASEESCSFSTDTCKFWTKIYPLVHACTVCEGIDPDISEASVFCEFEAGESVFGVLGEGEVSLLIQICRIISASSSSRQPFLQAVP